MENRGQFGSKFGFIMAAAGSAIGLGNLWAFPYKAGIGGGFAFILVYLFFVAMVGIPVMLSEFAIGRTTKSNVIGAYRTLDKRFTFIGVLGLVASFVILSFYAVLGGWVLNYTIQYIMKIFSADKAILLPGEYFNGFVSNDMAVFFCLVAFMVITLVIVVGGVEKGIEKAAKIMMPVLFIFLIIIIIRSVTLPGAGAGLEFLFKPDFSKLDINILGMALSQMFFSCSLGMGAMVTYGSYLSKNENIQQNAIIVPILDTVAAIMAGVAIFPAVFALGLEPKSGPKLMFITLPSIFNQMPFGNLFGVTFFILVLFAAVTSAISLLEVSSAYFIETFKIPRKKMVPILALAVIVCGTPVALGGGILGDVRILGMEILDFYDFLGEYIFMTVGALCTSVFVGWFLKPKKVVDEVTQDGKFKFIAEGYYGVTIKYVAPVLIFIVLVLSVTSML